MLAALPDCFVADYCNGKLDGHKPGTMAVLCPSGKFPNLVVWPCERVVLSCAVTLESFQAIAGNKSKVRQYVSGTNPERSIRIG